VPEKLAADLRERCRLPRPVPSEVDDAVLAMARQRLGRPRFIPLAIRWVTMAAAAAAVFMAVTLSWQGLTVRSRPEPQRALASALASADVDSNGRVDILDAFALARHLEAGEHAGPQWDVTGDGAVNRDDVDRIAFAAVDLRRGAF
jgi:hypothetical protein